MGAPGMVEGCCWDWGMGSACGWFVCMWDMRCGVHKILITYQEPPSFLPAKIPKALDDTDVVAYNLQHGAWTVRFVMGCQWLCNGMVTTLASGDVRRCISGR